MRNLRQELAINSLEGVEYERGLLETKNPCHQLF